MKSSAVMIGVTVLLAAAGAVLAIDGYKDTPMLPGGKWHVHDPDRPQPAVVTCGTASTQDSPGLAPSDANVLFDGKDVSKWVMGDGQPSRWTVMDGYMSPKGGDMRTKQEFGDCQLHLEWTTPDPPHGSGQERGNSGVYLFGRYEVQVLDNFNAQTYPDGQAGAIYGQFPPLVNVCRKPGEWQTYDIIFSRPHFSADGKLESPAYVTVLQNGVLVQNHTALLGDSGHRILAHYNPTGPKGPLQLQDHGNPVRYRNIWIRELPEQEETK